MSVGRPGGAAADSAGVTGGGRVLAAQPFGGDDGRADPALAAALAGHAAGRTPAQDVVAAFAAARVLVAVVAVPVVAVPADPVPGDAEPAGNDRYGARRGAGGERADMALITLTGPDGRRALPAFSCLAALAVWNPAARPVPVEATRASQAAVAEGCDVIVLDPAGPGVFVVARPAVWAVGQGRSWIPAAQDPAVAAAVGEALVGVPGVRGVGCLPGDTGDLVVSVRLPVGLEQVALDRVLAEVRDRLAGAAVIAERADSVTVRVLPA